MCTYMCLDFYLGLRLCVDNAVCLLFMDDIYIYINVVVVWIIFDDTCVCMCVYICVCVYGIWVQVERLLRKSCDDVLLIIKARVCVVLLAEGVSVDPITGTVLRSTATNNNTNNNNTNNRGGNSDKMNFKAGSTSSTTNNNNTNNNNNTSSPSSSSSSSISSFSSFLTAASTTSSSLLFLRADSVLSLLERQVTVLLADIILPVSPMYVCMCVCVWL